MDLKIGSDAAGADDGDGLWSEMTGFPVSGSKMCPYVLPVVVLQSTGTSRWWRFSTRGDIAQRPGRVVGILHGDVPLAAVGFAPTVSTQPGAELFRWRRRPPAALAMRPRRSPREPALKVISEPVGRVIVTVPLSESPEWYASSAALYFAQGGYIQFPPVQPPKPHSFNTRIYCEIQRAVCLFINGFASV